MDAWTWASGYNRTWMYCTKSDDLHMFGWCTKQFQTEINNFCAAFILMCATRQPKNLQHTLNSHVDTPHTNILINIKYVADGGWRYIMTWTNCWKLFAVSAFGHYFYSLGLFRLCVFSLLIFCFRFCFCFRRFERRADFKISHVFEKMNRIECACVLSFIWVFTRNTQFIM